MENKEVLAVVAGEEITKAELDELLKAVPREQQKYVNNPQFRNQYLEQMIAIRMFAKYGEEQKINETEEYLTILENAKRDILAQVAMSKVVSAVTVTEEETKDYYEANQKQFEKGETVSAKHILVKEEEKCASILSEIEKGEKSFEEAARAYSTCPSSEKGGDLGEFKRGQMVPEFENAAFDAEIGKVVGPVKTNFGYHLIKTEKKTEKCVTPFEEVKESIKRQMMQQKQADAYNKKVKELKEKYLEK